MKWYLIDNDYISYLQRFDSKVPNNNYGAGAIKPFVGIVLQVDDFKYYVPISSPKPKHNKMNESIDFIKLKRKGKLLGVINLNNMIPIADGATTYLNYRSIARYRQFNNSYEMTNYVNLLQNELSIVKRRSSSIIKNAARLRQLCIEHPDSPFAKRSCNFALLESKCKEYAPKLSVTQQLKAAKKKAASINATHHRVSKTKSKDKGIGK